MLILCYFLLMVRVGRSTGDLIFETKTVGVGDDVTLTCTRNTSWGSTQLFWIRLVSGDVPEVLGGTFAFDYADVIKTSRITAKQGPGTFLLHISKTNPSDTGVYCCMRVKRLNMTFLTGAFLRIKGPESDITAVIQDFSSDPVRPGDSVNLQCSVLSDYENKTCPGDHSVYWFRAGSDESHPRVIYTHGNRGDECEKSPEAHSLQKCVYNFSKTISSSDAGTYYCAVATCGEILFGNGRKLDLQAPMWNLQKATTVMCLLCAALAINLIVIAFLTYTIKKKTCDCNASAALQTNAVTASGDQRSQQRDEVPLVYSAPNITKRITGKAERRNAKMAGRRDNVL